MFDNLKLSRLLATFQLAKQPQWRPELAQTLGFPSLSVNLLGYPSHYFIRSGEWFRLDVPYPGATAEVAFPFAKPLGVRASEPFQIVCLLAIWEMIDSHRRRAYPLSDEDFAAIPPDWNARLEDRVRSIIDENLEFVVFLGRAIPKKTVRELAGGIIIEQRGLIGEFRKR